MSLVNKIKASRAIYQGETYLDQRDYRLALEHFRTAESLLGRAKAKPDFFNLYLKIAECSYLAGENDSGDAAILVAETKIAESKRLKSQEKDYLTSYARKLRRSAHDLEGGDADPLGLDMTSIRKSLLRDFPLEGWAMKDKAV